MSAGYLPPGHKMLAVNPMDPNPTGMPPGMVPPEMASGSQIPGGMSPGAVMSSSEDISPVGPYGKQGEDFVNADFNFFDGIESVNNERVKFLKGLHLKHKQHGRRDVM